MTLYQVIYDRFEKMIADFDLMDLVPANKAEIELDYLQQAITKYYNATVDLEDRDDDLLQFNFDLSEIEIQVLASFMVQVWTKPYLQNQDLMETHLITSEHRQFSPANRMKELMNLHKFAGREGSVPATRESVKKVLGELG